MKTRLALVTGFIYTLVTLISFVYGQADTLRRDFKRLDIFPAISYSPETSLTLGAIGIIYFNLGQDEEPTTLSNLEFLGLYTLNRQIIAEAYWDIFSNQNLWRTRGEVFYNRYPDRNYGMGNDAGALVVEVNSEGTFDTLNYLNFDSDRIKFSPVVLRRINSHLFIGLQYDMEYLYRMKIIPDQYLFINEDAQEIDDMPVEGLRSGLGVQLLFDNRSPRLNPLRGGMIEWNALHYHSYFGSDYQFTSTSIDLRYYQNTIKNHTLALKAFGSAQFTNDEVPMRALSRVGGYKLIRGYFKGTYQDYHMTGFEMEYRWPFWKENTTSKLWQVWKRLGVVTFLSGAQVYHRLSDFQIGEFNLAAGAGLRILFNPKTRVNLRIDYAVGLTHNSDGPGKRQHGLYFYLGEAF